MLKTASRIIAMLALAALCAGVAEARPARDATRMRIPGEFEPAAAIWLGFHRGHAELTAGLASALMPHVKLKLLVADESSIDEARAMLHDMGVATEGIEFRVDAQAIYFIRDSAVFTVGRRGELGVVDFKWGSYGLPTWCKRRHAFEPSGEAECASAVDTRKDALDRSIASLTQAKVIGSTLVMEGGGIESNGNGVIIVNEAMVTQRNPGRSRAELQRDFLKIPGIRKLLWLPEGLAEDPHLRSTIVGPYVGWGTGGHTDEFVRFADARTILLAWVDAAEAAAHPVARLNRQRLQRNLEILSRATDADGRPFRIVKIPMPRITERKVFLSADADPEISDQWTAEYFATTERRREGDAVVQVATSSYLNYVVANGVVVLPDYLASGTPKPVQARVRALFERAFPGRQIRFVDSLAANWLGGGPHCATLSEPAPAR